nr:hypothetical protein [uncultured Agathobaculum sp.]
MKPVATAETTGAARFFKDLCQSQVARPAPNTDHGHTVFSGVLVGGAIYSIRSA